MRCPIFLVCEVGPQPCEGVIPPSALALSPIAPEDVGTASTATLERVDDGDTGGEKLDSGSYLQVQMRLASWAGRQKGAQRAIARKKRKLKGKRGEGLIADNFGLRKLCISSLFNIYKTMIFVNGLLFSC